jgi:hypothetical protein
MNNSPSEVLVQLPRLTVNPGQGTYRHTFDLEYFCKLADCTGQDLVPLSVMVGREIDDDQFTEVVEIKMAASGADDEIALAEIRPKVLLHSDKSARRLFIVFDVTDPLEDMSGEPEGTTPHSTAVDILIHTAQRFLDLRVSGPLERIQTPATVPDMEMHRRVIFAIKFGVRGAAAENHHGG